MISNMKKSGKKTILLILNGLLVTLLLLTGCSGIEMEMETIVESSGELNIKTTVAVSTLILENIEGLEGFGIEEMEGFLQADGFEMKIEQEGDQTVYIYELKDRWDNYLEVDFLADAEANIGDLYLRVEDSFIFRDYYLESQIPIDEISPLKEQLTAELEVVGAELLAEMGLDGIDLDLLTGLINFNIIFTMPGDIVSNNADYIEGNSAYWVIDIFSTDTDQAFNAHSRDTKWEIVSGISGIVLVLIIITALLVLSLIHI